jgi:hypothetical protein
MMARPLLIFFQRALKPIAFFDFASGLGCWLVVANYTSSTEKPHSYVQPSTA